MEDVGHLAMNLVAFRVSYTYLKLYETQFPAVDLFGRKDNYRRVLPLVDLPLDAFEQRWNLAGIAPYACEESDDHGGANDDDHRIKF